MPEFHPKKEPEWKLVLYVLFALILLFLLEGFATYYEPSAPATAPGIPSGALYVLFAVFLFTLLMAFFINKWNSESVLSIDEKGVSFRSAVPRFLARMSYTNLTNSFKWDAVGGVRLIYGAPADRQQWAILIKKFRMKPNIYIFSGREYIFLHAKLFSPEDYARIVELLRQYARGKLKSEEHPDWA